MKPKYLITLSIVIFILLVIAGGVWYGEEKKIAEQSQLPKNTNEQKISDQNWKEYRASDLGVSFKYPEGFSIVLQPGAEKVLGTLFILSQDDYKLLQSNPEFQKNPLVAIVQDTQTQGFQLSWNASPWIAKSLKESGVEASLKNFLVRDSREVEQQGIKYEISLASFEKVSDTDQKSLYKYSLRITDVQSKSQDVRNGIIWSEESGVIVNMEVIGKGKANELSQDIVEQETKIVRSFRRF